MTKKKTDDPTPAELQPFDANDRLVALQLVKLSGYSPRDVIRRALRLYQIVQKHTDEGGTVILRTKNGNERGIELI